MACINIKSASEAIRAVSDLITSGSNWEEAFTGLVDSNANQIKNEVSEYLQRLTQKYGKPIAEYISENVRNLREFRKDWGFAKTVLLEKYKDQSSNPYADIDKTTNDIKLEFGSEDPGGFDRVKNSFEEGIVESAIFRIEKDINGRITSIDSVLSGSELNRNEQLNRNIHSMKMRLLEVIKMYTDINIDYDFGMNDGSFTQMIVNALLAFENKYKTDTSDSDIKKDAHDAYVILKYFDTFMSDIDFVQIRSSYKNSAGYSTQMYTYVGPQSNPSTHWGHDEIINAVKISSPILSLIFDHMPELQSDGNSYMLQDASKSVPVTSAAFLSIMSNFKAWCYATGKAEYFTGMDLNTLTNLLEQFLNAHLDPDVNFIKYKTGYENKIRGILAILKSQTIDPNTKQFIWKQVSTNEQMLYNMYTIKNGKMHRQGGKQRLINLQEIKILDRVRNAVFERTVLNPNSFSEFQVKYNIFPDKINKNVIYMFTDDSGNPIDGTVKLVLNKNGKVDTYYYRSELAGSGQEWTSTTKSHIYKVGSNSISLGEVDVEALNDKVQPVIEELLGMVPDGWKNFTSNHNLLDLFSQVLGCTMFAINGASPSMLQFDFIGEERIKFLKTTTTPFRGNNLLGISEMFASAYGADVTVTLKNLNGDSIPAFSLTSWIHGINKLVPKLKQEARRQGVHNALSGNFVVSNYLKVGAPFVRRDMQIGSSNKQSSQYSENEVMYLGIVCDFFESLYDDKNDSIFYQNTTNSDKSTHWIIPYAKDIVVGTLDGEEITLEAALKHIIQGDVNDQKTYSAIVLNKLYDCRRSEYLMVAKNLINDYNQVFGWSLSTDAEDIYDSIEELVSFINTYNSAEHDNKTIEENFNAAGVEFVNELHLSSIQIGGKKVAFFNQTLFDEFSLYLSGDSTKFFNRMNLQLDYFIKDLVDENFELNIYDDKGVKEILQNFKDGEKWLDKKSGNLLLKKGTECNPLLLSYFVGDILLSTEFNKLVNGFHWMHPSKYDPDITSGDFLRADGKASTGADGEVLLANDGTKIIYRNDTFYNESGEVTDALNVKFHENFYIHDSAKRLAASYKRTVINGATVELYTPQHRGLGDEFVFAAVKDIPGTVWNMMGEEKTNLDSMDGSAFVHPVFAILCGWSSPTGKVTYDNKTICGDLSAKFGLPTLFKWAEFGLTNHRRQMGFLSDASAEHAYEVLSSIPIRKHIQLEYYYGYSRAGADKTVYNPSGQNQTLYRKDPFTGKFYLISDISTSVEYIADQNGDFVPVTECKYSLTEVDKNGRIIGNAERQSRQLKTIYDIDQVLGGAWCMKLGENGLENYDGNISTLAEIVCQEGLKNKIIAYIVNNSAMKVGNRNINGVELFDRDFARNEDGSIDYTKILTSTCSTINLGKQMDPDHELEFSEVSEMSQMISALIQGGHFTELVNQIYIEIGKVAAEAMRLTQSALDRNDDDEIYRILGENLMEAFETGNRNTTGLAQSFLIKAKKSLQDKNIEFEIPFSGPTINAAFISDVVATINKKGIRRKYSGIASVLVPSNNMIQVFRYGGKTMMFNEFAQKVVKDFPRPIVGEETAQQRMENDLKHVQSLLTNVQYAYEHGALQKIENIRDEADLIEETVVIGIPEKDPNTGLTTITFGEPIKIDSLTTFDKVKHFLPKDAVVYNWTVKPKNLRQSNVTCDVNILGDIRGKVIWAHPTMGKTTVYENDTTGQYVDFDSVYKKPAIQQLGFSGNESDEAWKEWKRSHLEQWNQIRRDLFEQAINDIREQNKTLLCSDVMFLEESEDAIDYIITSSQEAFIEKSALRGESDDNGRLSKWKGSIDFSINNIKNKSKVLMSDLFLSDILATKKISIYELDSSRALSYLTSARKLKKKTGVFSFGENSAEKIKVVQNALRQVGIEWDGIKLPSSAQLAQWNNLLSLQVKSDLAELDQPNPKLNLQTAFGITSLVPIKVASASNVVTRHAEMIMGRLHAAELGLRPGDDLNQIKEEKDQFFLKRLQSKQTIKKAKNIYDYAITTSTGHTMYITVKENHDPKEIAPYTSQNKKFTHEDTGIWYNHTDKICDFVSEDCRIATIQNDAKEVCPLIIVKSNEDVDTILKGEGVDFVHYNINANNIKPLTKRLFGENINVTLQKRAIDQGRLTLVQNVVDNFDQLDEFTQNKYLVEIENYIDEQNRRKLEKLAHKQWLAFKAQLLYVGARIPTQSMQSFQALELIGFSESLKNEVYVPKVQTWLQGSDYDIDKLYIMSFNIAKNGTLATFSKLANEPELQDLMPVIRLKSPNGRYYQKLDRFSIFGQEVKDLYLTDNIVLNSTIDEFGNTIYTISNIVTNSSVEFTTSDQKQFNWTKVDNLANENKVDLLKVFIELAPEDASFYIDDTISGTNDIRSLLLNGASRSGHLVNVDGVFKKGNDFEYKFFTKVGSKDVSDVNSLTNFDIFNNISKTSSRFVIFDDDVDISSPNRFINLLNKHNQGDLNLEKSIHFSTDPNAVTISKDDINEIINNNREFIGHLLKDSQEIVLSNDLSAEERKAIIKALNDYKEGSVKIPGKERALQNAVLGGILTLLEKRTIQPYGHNPISLDDIKALVETDVNDLRMSMDNAFVKFKMQVENMVGKAVIGISAVSMKVFFAASTYFNMELERAVQSYLDCNDVDFASHLCNILFVDKLSGSPEINTMANLNLQPLEKLIERSPSKDILIPINYINNKIWKTLAPALSPFRVGNSISLKALLYGKKNLRGQTLVKGLIEKSQSQDAAQNISQLLSAATDNAKELILAKINATSEFADFWGAMLMTGHSFIETNATMQSKFFNKIAKLSKGFMMSKLHQGVTSRNVIKFMALDGNIPSINAKVLRYVLGSVPAKGLDKCFFLKMRYETDASGNLLTLRNGQKVPITSKDTSIDKLIKRQTPLYFFKPTESGELQKITIDDNYIQKLLAKDNTTLKDDVQYWLTSSAVVSEFGKHLRSLLPNESYEDIMNARPKGAVFDEDSMEQDFDEEDYTSSFDQDFDEDGEAVEEEILPEGTTDDYRMLIRYTDKFLIQRANLIEEDPAQFGKFKNVVDNVFPITEEQRIAGIELGVNQGIPTNEFDFYNKLLGIENFVNKAYNQAKLPADFDIIRFVTEDEYRNQHIDKYETIKKALNPLAIISKVPNFAQMFKFYGTANKLLNRSAQFKLDFLVARQILNDNTKRMNSDEFKAVHNAIKDSLILSWMKQKNISITLPKNQLIYLPKQGGNIAMFYTPVDGKELNLRTPEDMATFKRLMDSYVFPKLKEKFGRDNKFVRTIDSTTKIDPLHKQLKLRKRMPIDMMKVDDSKLSKDMFTEIMTDFGKIAKDTEFLKELKISDGSVTLGDLIYLYNLYVYKDSFSQDSFTRIFEVMNVYNNDALINNYYTWLAKLDKGLYQIDDLSSFVSEDGIKGSINTGSENIEFEIKTKDVLYRLSTLDKAAERIHIQPIYDSKGGISKIQQCNKFGKPIGKMFDVKCKDASDFCMELPFSSGMGLSTEELKEMGYDENDVQQRFVPNSREVWNATLDILDEICPNAQQLIQHVDNQTFDEWQKNPEKSPIDLSDKNIITRISRSHGFIHAGVIYINKDNINATASTKVHELAHLMCALWKFSGNKTIRNQYYELVDSVISMYDEATLRSKAKDIGFTNIHNPDFKEEVFVDEIARAFKVGLDKTVFADGNRFSKTSLRTKLKSAVEQLFSADIENSIPLQKIGNTTIQNIVSMFGKWAKELDNDPIKFKANLVKSAELKAFKQYLIKDSESEFNKSSEGIFYTC